MRTHQLKCVQPYFSDIVKRIKTFELRLNDRDFKIGETVVLYEYIAEKDFHTGKWITFKISYIMPVDEMLGTNTDYVILGINNLKCIKP